MANYNIIFTKEKSTCPKCAKKKRFSRLVNTETGELLPPEYGRCDRIESCGYHKPVDPTVFGRPRTEIPRDVFEKTGNFYHRNNLAIFLVELFGKYAHNIFRMYRLGTAKDNKCIFWYIDQKNRIRSGKIMDYDRTGHRVKTRPPVWVHTTLYDEYDFTGCLFGEHLLQNSNRPVALVESEKTAMICAGYMPEQYIWLAVGGSSGIGGKILNHSRVNPLRGRKVVMFPDLSRHGTIENHWKDLAAQMQKIDIDARVESGWMETADDMSRERGEDLADLLTRWNSDIILPHLINTEDVTDKFYIPF